MRGPAYGLRGWMFPRGEGFAPSADVGGKAVGVGRTPRSSVVEIRGRRLRDQRIDDAPLLFERVGATETTRVTLHRVFQETLVRLGSVTEHLVVLHFEVDRPRRQLVARGLRLEMQHDAVVRTQPEAQEVRLGIAVSCIGEQQTWRRLEFDDRLSGGDR